MESFLLVVILLVLFIRWMILSGRMAEMDRKILELDLRPADARLIARVYALERAMEGLRSERPAAPSAPIAVVVAPPRPVEPEWKWEPPKPEPVIELAEAPVVMELPLRDISVSEATFASSPTPTISERLREKMSGEEWEAIVGGSWLNKLGVFVLVIGIALFLGYSFTKMGPPGRVGIGLAVSLAMLGGGIVLEKRARYMNFARGLLGGGWGALYFTTYAMHSVEAAKVI
ncbi:MAG TPA: DUF2339 domain-containing protein, partial [Bryobacteraceae bacterium]|nr:DUF2339 domain-containing protein [Bryobacteraceae bacterium]